MVKKILFAGLLGTLLFSACKKQTEEFQIAEIADYAPLAVGKYITYQLDSTRFLPFSLQTITTSYQVKYLVDAAITDNLGRPAFRIIRQIRKDSGAEWVPDNTFMAVNTGTSLEFTDNNQRFIKLTQPIQAGYNWKGNVFVDLNQVDPQTGEDFSHLENWTYTYDSLDAPLTLDAITIENTVKVAQADEIIGNPGDPQSYAEKNYSVEYYAKGIGLVYKSFYHSEYQPPTSSGGTGSYTSDSKGFVLKMIDHN